MDEVILLAGPQGAGKTTAADMLIQHFEQRGVSTRLEEMSSFIRSDWQRRDEPADSLATWAAEMKDEHGIGCFASKLAAAVYYGDCDAERLVVSGIRSPEEIDAFESVFDCDVRTIALWSLPDVRFERKYGEAPSPKHEQWESFHERDEQELFEWGCASLYANNSDSCADHIVPNNGDISALRGKMRVLSFTPLAYRTSPFPHDDVERVQQYL